MRAALAVTFFSAQVGKHNVPILVTTDKGTFSEGAVIGCTPDSRERGDYLGQMRAINKWSVPSSERKYFP